MPQDLADQRSRPTQRPNRPSTLYGKGIQVSGRTVHRILRKHSFRKSKPTKKPGLSAAQKKARLDWCLAHQHWTLEDWKKVISKEGFDETVIRPRWKGFSEFMFWGSFSYDWKGPCYIWGPETAAEKKQAELDIAAWNQDIEPVKKAQWELEVYPEER
jgi:hypothetical protein